MKAIKRAYTHPPLRLYSPNGEILSVLSGNSIKNAYDIVKTSTRNDVDKLSFKIAYKDGKQLLNYNSCEMLLKFEKNEIYIIKNAKLSDENKRVIEVTAENFFAVLKGIKCQSLNLIGQSPEELFNAIIASPKNVNLVGKYKFKGTDIVNTFRAVQTEDEASVFENLLTLCEKFNAFMEFSFDDNGKWIYIRKTPINKGKFIKKGKGLKSLDIEVDSSEIFTRMYGYGVADPITGNEITFMSVNPTGKAYVENTDYFKALGMTDEEISNNEQVLQECDFRDNTITTPAELFRITQEELAKVCVPKITGTISMSDFSVYEGSSLTEPSTSEEITFIDQDINFNIKCWIESIERRYSENPMDISVTISNVVKYDSTLKDLVKNSDTTTKTTTTDPNTGKPYVPASTVKLTDPITGDFVPINVTAGNLNSRITNTAGEIRFEVSEADKKLQTSINLNTTQILAVVYDGSTDQSGQWALRKDSLQIAFTGVTADTTTIDANGITTKLLDTNGTVLGYTRMGSKGLEHLDSFMTNGKPYHYLNAVITKRGIQCADGNYHSISLSLPTIFSKIENPDENISVSVSVAKVYDSNTGSKSLCYAFGAYASIVDGQIALEVMSAWRDYSYGGNDTDDWVESFSSPRGGLIDVNITLIA